MGDYLNWTFDHRMHQNPNCDFFKKVTELLGQRQDEAHCQYDYFILPNYSFNHLNPGIMDQTDLVIGKLFLRKQPDQEKQIYDIRRIDSTSGENLCLRTVMNNDAHMSLEDQRILCQCINGKAVPAQHDDWSADGSFLTSIYGIPELIRKYQKDILDFSFMDRHGMIYSKQKLKKLRSDLLRIKGENVKITGYCLLGYANPPSYWWMDSKGCLLIVSTPLLTYVAGPAHMTKPCKKQQTEDA